MEQIFTIIQQIKAGNQYQHKAESGKIWTVKKKGVRFEISHNESTEKRSVPERGVQKILCHILNLS